MNTIELFRIMEIEGIPADKVFAIERVIVVSDVESIVVIRSFGGEKHEVRIPFGRTHMKQMKRELMEPLVRLVGHRTTPDGEASA